MYFVAQVQKSFTLDPIISAWLLMPGMLLAGLLTFYLYRAQGQIASRRVVSTITVLLFE